MPQPSLPASAFATLAMIAVGSPTVLAAEPATIGQEVIIDMDGAEPAGGAAGGVLIIEQGPAAPNELIIDGGEGDTGVGVNQEPASPGIDLPEQNRFEFRIDDMRAEYGQFTRSDSEADYSLYGKVSAYANWQPSSQWEYQLAGRIDGYDQRGDLSASEVIVDYGDSYIRYRGDQIRLTAGTQTVVWGRLDELPLSDRVSTADLTRFVLDNLEDRRRSNPMLRAETFLASGKLDLVWLFDFRAAELPDQDSVWYPVNRQTGRILGISPDVIPPAAVQGAVIIEDEPDGDGGFGARYTRTHSFADIGMTVARTRQSTPYFRVDGANQFRTEYPRSWAYGADAAIDAAGATWRVEVVYSSDNPVTRTDFSYTTTPGIAWGGGVEFHPGDGDTRVNLQLIGMNLIDAPQIIDRKEIYSLNGEIEVPFDRERWRVRLDFYAGLDEKDVYLNPEVTFLGWEPHEIYAALHYFDGDDRTIGGFHEDHSTVQLGWRTSF